MRERAIEPWWTEQALARGRYLLGRTDEARRELQQWIEQAPTFTRWTFLASFERFANDNSRAIGALRKAAKFKLDKGAGRYVPGSYAYHAAAFAYSMEEFPLAIRICDIWQRGVDHAEFNHRFIRGASNLALGHIADALADAEAAVSCDVPLWAGDPERLLRAAQEGNQSWRAKFDNEDLELAITYK